MNGEWDRSSKGRQISGYGSTLPRCGVFMSTLLENIPVTSTLHFMASALTFLHYLSPTSMGRFKPLFQTGLFRYLGAKGIHPLHLGKSEMFGPSPLVALSWPKFCRRGALVQRAGPCRWRRQCHHDCVPSSISSKQITVCQLGFHWEGPACRAAKMYSPVLARGNSLGA